MTLVVRLMVVRFDEAIALDICPRAENTTIGAREISHLGIWKGFGSFF